MKAMLRGVCALTSSVCPHRMYKEERVVGPTIYLDLGGGGGGNNKSVYAWCFWTRGVSSTGYMVEWIWSKNHPWAKNTTSVLCEVIHLSTIQNDKAQ